MKKILFVVTLCILAFSCKETEQSKTNTNTKKAKKERVIEQVTSPHEWEGAYFGELPNGIKTLVVLKNNMPFKMITKASKSKKESQLQTGVAKWNADGTIVSLGDKHFKVNENRLSLLGKDMTSPVGEEAVLNKTYVRKFTPLFSGSLVEYMGDDNKPYSIAFDNNSNPKSAAIGCADLYLSLPQSSDGLYAEGKYRIETKDNQVVFFNDGKRIQLNKK